ncbi:hypothetical protein HK100_003764, partial [Physocladia obscura]
LMERQLQQQQLQQLQQQQQQYQHPHLQNQYSHQTNQLPQSQSSAIAAAGPTASSNPTTTTTILASSRNSHSHPINVSWLFPHQVLAPSPNASLVHPDGIVPKDILDLLGVSQKNYPQGRAPSNSGFIGGFPVAKTTKTATVSPDSLSARTLKSSKLSSFSSVHQSAVNNTNTNHKSTLVSPPAKLRSPAATTDVASSSSATLLLTTATLSSTTSTTTTTSTPLFSADEIKTVSDPLPTSAPNISVTTAATTVAIVATNNESMVTLDIPPLLPTVAISSEYACTTGGREEIEAMEASEAMQSTTSQQQQQQRDAEETDAQHDASSSSSLGFLTLPNGVVVKGDPVGTCYGNVGLSSCPGKKVRLDTGPVNGRAAINRDLDADFARLASLGIHCLNDAEMAYLGAPYVKYEISAKKHGMQVLRIPIIEGSCPDKLEDVSEIVDAMDVWLRKGVNVLVHCRGGVGRAGLIACCLLLRKRFVENAARAIQFVRIRRSLKAIETLRQEDFIQAFAARENEAWVKSVGAVGDGNEGYVDLEVVKEMKFAKKSDSTGAGGTDAATATLDVTEKLAKSTLEIDILLKELQHHNAINYRLKSANGAARSTIETLTHELEEKRADRIEITADMARQFKSMQSEMTARINGLEAQVEDLKERLAASQTVNQESTKEYLRIIAIKDEVIEEQNVKMSYMSAEFEAMLNDTLGKMSKKLDAVSQRWKENDNMQISDGNARKLADFNLSRLVAKQD